MTTLTDSTTPLVTHGRTHPAMITPTWIKIFSFDEIHAVLVKAVPFLRCSIWRQAAKNLVESRTGLGLPPLGNATGSRDAP